MDMIVPVHNDKLISASEAATIIGCTHGRVCQLLRSQELPGELLNDTIWVIKKSDAEKYARKPQTVGRPRNGAA